MTKKKILWVVYGFVQAGGERYVFEICKALNKKKYQVDILHITPLGFEKAWNNEFYYKPTLELGCTIFSLSDVLKPAEIKLSENFLQRASGYIKRKFNQAVVLNKEANKVTESSVLKDFFAEYDHINFSGVSVYKNLCIARKIEPQNGIIHILSAGFQDNKNLYEDYNKNFNYNFVSSISLESLQPELKEIKNYGYTHYPLCFETIPYDTEISGKKGRPYKIAVFTRLSPMKPLDPYFYALKLLIEQGIDVELQVYGSGNPEQLGLLRQLNYLYIADKVKFMGHTESIPKTLQTSDIDLIWFQSNNKLPAGYAALEICMTGLPQVFWDFMDLGQSSPLQEVFPSFSKIIAFTNYSKELLFSEDDRRELGTRQKDYVLKNHSNEAHIHILEEMYDNKPDSYKPSSNSKVLSA